MVGRASTPTGPGRTEARAGTPRGNGTGSARGVAAGENAAGRAGACPATGPPLHAAGRRRRRVRARRRTGRAASSAGRPPRRPRRAARSRQFLSPLVNTRTDRWGGSLENRAQMLLDVVRAVRAAVSPSFAVAVKLNSADFQRGGFDADDARRVIALLEPLGVDLVELSGGSYESPAMTGRSTDTRTQAREAYFLDLAKDLVRTSPLPLMLTGGITRRATAQRVLDSGVAVVGMGTALAVTPDLPDRWRQGREAERAMRPVNWSDKALASAASMAQVRHRMRRLARGSSPRPGTHPAVALVSEQRRQRAALRTYRAWLADPRRTA
ncbi:2,4-dienoyl-CoA reductase [Streptomyces albidoflavus]